MTYYLIKIGVTTVLIVAISELSRRNSFIGAVLASIPIISVVAMFWLYNETNDIAVVSSLSKSIFWLVLPSLTLFLTLPVLLKTGLPFYPSMGIAIGVTVGCYFVMIATLKFCGINL
ncbi:MAG: DUF3147 family protein [Desulforhopalus sp.]